MADKFTCNSAIDSMVKGIKEEHLQETKDALKVILTKAPLYKIEKIKKPLLIQATILLRDFFGKHLIEDIEMIQDATFVRKHSQITELESAQDEKGVNFVRNNSEITVHESAHKVGASQSEPECPVVPLSQDDKDANFVRKNSEIPVIYPLASQNKREDENTENVKDVRKELKFIQSQSTICWHYKVNKCKFGASGRRGGKCEFLHPKKCFFYMHHGKTQDGCDSKKCQDYHPPLCHWSVKGKKCEMEKCSKLHLIGNDKMPGKKTHTRNETLLTNLAVRNSLKGKLTKSKKKSPEISQARFLLMKDKLFLDQNKEIMKVLKAMEKRLAKVEINPSKNHCQNKRSQCHACT